jgi:outer membrane protein assembly factor BamB
MSKITACVFASLLFASSLTARAANWPEFRGPTGDGHVAASTGDSAKPLPLEWSETKNVRWKTEIPYRGWSTPVVMDGQVWLTTATEDGHDFYALCLDADTGKILHNERVFHSDNPEPLGNNVNCYAACSPAIEPGRVYVHFGSYGTACLDTSTGKAIWSRDDMPCRHWRGPSSSVVLFDNLAILTFDGADLQYVTALDKETGQTVWRTDRDVEWNDQNITGEYAKYADMAKVGDFRKAHSTPLVVNSGGEPLLVSGGAKATFGYDPHTGKEKWRVHYDDWSVAPRPLYQNGVAYIVSGLMHPELMAVKTDGIGDVTDSGVLWRLKTGVPKTASPLLVDGLLYMVGDDGVASCVDSADGSVVWRKRLGGRFAASPIYAPATANSEPRIYFSNQDGKTTVIKPGREFEQLATNTLDDGFMASPAAADGALYLRTKTNLYRIEEPAN